MHDHSYYLQLLQRYDEPMQWEHPAIFDYTAACATFRAFADAVQARSALRCHVETDNYIQDASFIGQIIFPRAALVQQDEDDEAGIIRVSNFGNMATVNEEDVFPPALLATIKETMDSFGYRYVPPEVLCQPYTGSGVTGVASWWLRYFDWT